MNVDDARFDQCETVLVIDAENLIHSRKFQDNSAVNRNRSATQARACSPGQEGHLVSSSQFDDLDNIFCRAWKHHKIGKLRVEGKTIALVNDQLFGSMQHPI